MKRTGTRSRTAAQTRLEGRLGGADARLEPDQRGRRRGSTPAALELGQGAGGRAGQAGLLPDPARPGRGRPARPARSRPPAARRRRGRSGSRPRRRRARRRGSVTSGMPRSRSSSLSRSNIRSKASVEVLRPYCGTACADLRLASAGGAVLSRQMTRLSRRSVLAAATWVSSSDADGTGRRRPGYVSRSVSDGAVAASGRSVDRWSGAVEPACGRAGRRAVGRRPAAPCRGAPVRALAYPDAGRRAAGRRPGAAERRRSERGLGTGGYRAGRRAARTACPPTPAGAGAGPPGQGPVHPAAGDGARRRRAGVAAPRGAARRRRPRRDAGRRGRPALGAAGGARRAAARSPRRRGWPT